MEQLITKFNLETVHEFNESSVRPGHRLRIAIKSHFRHGKEEAEKGIKYYILDDDGKISSDEMTQSWEVLKVWFKVFKKHEEIGTYDFNKQVINYKN